MSQQSIPFGRFVWARWLARGAWLAVVMLGQVAIVGSTAIAADSITGIEVQGNRRMEPETVRTYLKLKIGEMYDAGKADESIRSLFATGLFSDVHIDRKGSSVVVTVVENPVVNQLAFEGNREVDKATLMSEVQLKPRSIFTRAKAQADVQRILDVYQRQGRFAASVEPKIIELENNRVNVVFEINEGTATKVQAINIIGNKAFSDSQLRDVITTSQSGWFDFLKSTNVYDPDRLALDRELMRQYYLKNGYADARIVSAGAELARGDSGFNITFVVDEGELFTFGKVDIESVVPNVDAKVLRGELLTVSGNLYNQFLMDKTVEKLTLLVSQQGFAFARVRPRAVREPGTRTIDIIYVIDQGPRMYIERININGNARTHDYVIRREFGLAEGDAYNAFMVDRAKKRVQALGFFKAVDIKRRPGSAPDRVVLDVDVVEQPSGDISFGAGYSTSEGVIGEISFTERNLMGRGQYLRLKLGGSIERLQVDLSFTEPRFLNSNVSAGFDIFHKEVTDSDYQAYDSRTSGFALRLAFPLTEALWLNTSYKLSNNEISEVEVTASQAIKEAEGQYWTSLINTSFVYDKRDNPKNPNSGWYFQVGADFAGLGGDVRYIRPQGELRYYAPIFDSVTFAARASAGYIQGLGGQDIRLMDLFYKGGETIRGFSQSGYGPRDLLTGDALGGHTFWAVSTEVRFPLPVPQELGMKGAFFFDAGSLWGAGAGAKELNKKCGEPGYYDADSDSTIYPGVCLADSNSIRASVGFSLIWESPMGPLRLDIAKAILKESYDDEQVVRIGASTRF